jgi:hypothetical protein
MTFYAIASSININENEKIHAIWNELDFVCEMNQVKFAPIPHFSYMTYEGELNSARITNALKKIAAETKPFQIQISGLGVFQGKTPILYLPIVKTRLLLELHSRLVSEVYEYVDKASSFYLEENWIPHITLAIRDINLENLSCAVDQCMNFDLSFRLNVDQLAILYMDEESFGIKNSFKF